MAKTILKGGGTIGAYEMGKSYIKSKYGPQSPKPNVKTFQFENVNPNIRTSPIEKKVKRNKSFKMKKNK